MPIASSELGRSQQESGKLPLRSESNHVSVALTPPVSTYGDSYTLSHNNPCSVTVHDGNYCLLMLLFPWHFSLLEEMHFSFNGESSSKAEYLFLTFLKRKRRSYMLAFSCNHFKHLQTLMVCLSKPVRTGRFLFFFLAGGESS